MAVWPEIVCGCNGPRRKGKRREGQVFFAVGFFLFLRSHLAHIPFSQPSPSPFSVPFAPPPGTDVKIRASYYTKGKSVKGSGGACLDRCSTSSQKCPIDSEFSGKPRENVFSGQVGSLGGDRGGGPAGHVRRFQLRARRASAATSEGHIPVRLAGQFLCFVKEHNLTKKVFFFLTNLSFNTFSIAVFSSFRSKTAMTWTATSRTCWRRRTTTPPPGLAPMRRRNPGGCRTPLRRQPMTLAARLGRGCKKSPSLMRVRKFSILLRYSKTKFSSAAARTPRNE